MTLPVSSYEELLARVRSLTSETIQLRREITSSLSDQSVLGSVELPAGPDSDYHMIKRATLVQRGTSTGEDLNTANASDFGRSLESPVRSAVFFDKKENEIDNEFKEIDEKLTSPGSPVGKNSFRRSGWAPDSLGLWRSGPSSLNLEQPYNNYSLQQDLTSSVNYTSNEPQSLNTLSSSKRIYSHQQLGAKVEMVYSLLSMLDMNNREDMSKTFLAMSSSPESCHAMRQSGCLPLLIQLIHSSELNKEVRVRAAEALHNIVHSQTDEKRRKREVRVLKLLQQVREYCDELKNNYSQESLQLQEPEKHPINAIGTLMKFSFDAEHRQAICILGGLHAISELIQIDYEAHGDTTGESLCITLRRYAGMSLTNLTFGDCKNKSLLCSFNKFMHALVSQLKSPCEDLRQVTASVLRNLSWRADSESKQALRDVGAVTALTVSAMEGKKESTLKSILSALWNLSAHCSLNKVDICSVPGALAFLVKMLKYKSSSNTLAIVENAGGILRNISSHIAVREDYRQILRENNCFEILLEQLKSPSLTVVSNACGTLWNLSARCTEDQRRLWEMGATSMLRSLVQSKHKMISMGSSAALKNLLAANPNENLLTHLDSTAKSLGLQNLPTLFVRKKRALEQELNITLAETCDNIDSVESPTHLIGKTEMKKVNGPKRSESRDSVQSTQSDSTYERLNQISLKSEEKLLENKNITLHDSLDEKSMPRKLEDQKLIKRYTKSSMIPTPTFKKVNQDRINEKTKEEHTQGNIAGEVGVKTDIKKDLNRDSKEEHKNEVPAPNTEPGSLKIPNNQCSSLNNSFPTPSKEYFVKCKENESLQGVENVEQHNTNFGYPNSEREFNSLPYVKQVIPDFDNERNTRVKSKCVIHSDIQNGSVEIVKSERLQENKEKQEILGTSRNRVLEAYLPNTLNVEKCVSSLGTACIPREFDEKVTENASEREIAECTSFGASDESETSASKFLEKTSQRDLRIDFLPKNFICEDRHQNIIQKPSPALFPEVPSSGQSSKINALTTESNKIIQSEENESCFLNQKRKVSKEQNELHETAQTSKMPVQGNLYETSGEESLVLLARSSKPSHQSPGLSSPSLNLEGRAALPETDDQSQKLTLGMVDFPEAKVGEAKCTNFSSADSNGVIDRTNDSEPKPTEISICHPDFVDNVSKSTFNSGDESDLLRVGNIDGAHLKSMSNVVLPKFKVGSPMTDAKVLQMEANKICREIKKHQDFEMGCSLTSEVSLVSCSSFIDPGDFSLFDSSTDAAELEDPENLDFVKVTSKSKNVSLRRPMTCQNIESVSLPSLGSLKNEQIEALDLDSSILSVASITSEIAETYSKDFETFQTYTKTYKIDTRDELHDDTVADATLVFNEDDTLNADSLQNNPEFFDEDNSLCSQENLPLDTENLEESSSDRLKKKLTPKEKRRTFQERYRTYTIRDINGCRNSEIPSAATSQGVEVTLKKDEASVSCAQGGDQHQHSRDTVNGNSCVRRIGNGEVNGGKAKFECPTRTLCNDRKQEVFVFSKGLSEAEISDLVRMKFSVESSDVMNIGPAERKELVDNAKLVAFSLKTAVQDYEMVSDFETEDPHVDFDTATYSKNFRDQHRYVSSPQEQDKQCLQQDEAPVLDEDPEKKGARILKPNKKSDEKLEETAKGIRGRRKPLYSSPQKHSRRTTGSPVNLSKTSHVVTDTKKSLSDNFVLPILHREGTFTKEDGSVLKKNESKNTRTIPVLCRNTESKSVSSAKAANGNRSTPFSASPKRNGENHVSKIGRPMSTYTTKVNEKRLELDSIQRRSFSADAGNKIGGDITATTKKSTPTGLTSPKMRNPSSNQNLKAGNSPGSGFINSKTTLQNSKSQSDANLNLAACKDKGKQKTPRKEVTSKIASLWRKVEESKQKNKTSKDNRVWISSEKNTAVGDEVLIVEREEILDIPTRRIVHSLTCQALSDEISTEITSQERTTRPVQAFSQFGGSEGKNERIERRNVISAVVPPYNYSPPTSEKTTPLKIKQVDTFHKGSLKVTTV